MTHALRLTKQILVKVCRAWEASPDSISREEFDKMEPDARGDMTAEFLWEQFRQESGEYTEAAQNAEREADETKVRDEMAAESGASGRDLDVTARLIDEPAEAQTIGTEDVAKVTDALRSKKR